jgi:thioester reductase-like protein
MQAQEQRNVDLIFITGATGAIGSRLVAELLARPAVRMALLVRAADANAAAARMARLLRYWDIDPDSADVRERVSVIPGDIMLEDLGMPAERYAALAAQVTHVVHAATDIKLSLPLEQARRISVGGTRNVVRFARQCQRSGTLRGFTFLSTVEVAGDYSEVIYEEFLTDYRRGFLNSYEITKAEAEEYLREEIANGLPVTIYRASMVVGDSQSGKSSRFGSFYYLLSDMLLSPPSPVMPGADTFIVDTIPVDFVAKAIACLYDDPETHGKVFHATAGLEDPLTVPALCRRAAPILNQALGLELRTPRFISPALVRAVTRGLSRVTFGALRANLERQLIFLDFFVNRWQLDNRQMRAAAARHGLELPHLLECLPALCRYYLSARRGRGGVPRELAEQR